MNMNVGLEFLSYCYSMLSPSCEIELIAAEVIHPDDIPVRFSGEQAPSTRFASLLTPLD